MQISEAEEYRVEIGGGRYRLVRRLGAGGTGVVYQAADALLGRTVAVKALDPSLPADLIRSEARSLAGLNHPHIVTLHDLVEEDGRLFLVMEYVDGSSLQQRLERQGPLPLEAAVEIVRQVAQAVWAAHQNGTLHCDLKPANILLVSDGAIKLSDFTLAQQLDRGRFSGPAGLSARYAAPEQISGDEVSPRTDIYGLGKLLRDVVDPGAWFTAEGRALATVVEQATAIDPEDRYASVEEFLLALPDSGSSITQFRTPSSLSQLTRVAPLASTPSRPNLRRQIAWRRPAGVGLLSVGALALAGAAFSHFTAVASPAHVIVPNLVATQSDSAQLVVRSMPLHYQVRQVYSDRVAGTVIAQQPAPGSSVADGATLTLVVSKGPRPVAVPDLTGMPQAAALQVLSGRGLRAVVQTQDTISHPSGTVLDQKPQASTSVLPGTTVTVIVSSKPWWWPF